MIDDTKIEIHPESWGMPNRKGFNAWVHKTFHTDRYPQPARRNEGCTPSEGGPANIRLFPHQRLIRDYMQFDSPYRGILLYHGLGVGKTCASIAAAEGFLAQHRKIVVMVPASLATNYKQEIMRCATVGNPSSKHWNYIEVKNHKDVSLPSAWITKKKNKVWYSSVPDGTKVIRENVSWRQLSQKEQEDVMETVMEMVNHKYTFINFNGLTTKMVQGLTPDFFKDAFVVMDEAHNFMSRVMNGRKIATALYNSMMQAKNIRLVLLSGTPVINHPYELSILLNLLRGPMRVYEGKFLQKAASISEDTIRDVLKEYTPYLDHVSIHIDTHKVEFTMVPFGFVSTDEKTLKKEAWPMSEEDMITKIQEVLNKRAQVGKRFAKKDMYALPLKKEEFNTWFLDETDPSNPKTKNMDLFVRRIMGVVSYFRTAGEEYFPQVIVRKNENIPLTDYQFSVYSKVRMLELKMEERKRKMARFVANAGVFGGNSSLFSAFSRMACNFVFPEEIKRKYPMELRKELRSVIQREVDVHEEDVDHEKEEETGDKDEKKLVKLYEEDLRRVIEDVKKNASRILDRKMLKDVYSPKFARALEHIEQSPGKSLVYSQFRVIEGLGMMKLVLDHAGFVEVKLEKKGSKWTIHNLTEVFDNKYNEKRYAVFDMDREKTKMLLHIYNGEFSQLPEELQEELRSVRVGNNIRGEAMRVFMITQSGAEGISLKNVRRVILLENFWNMVRIDQVIGRAVRTCSHQELPPEDRNVEVYILTSVLTNDQLKSAFTIKRKDGGLTSDEHVMKVANAKNQIIQAFLDHMKIAAFDCRNHASTNKLMSQGLRCYAFPIPVSQTEESFVPSIEHDSLRKSRFVRKKKIQGQVITMQGKKYVIVDDYPNKLFDYHAYKDAGVLTEALIS